VGTNIADAPCWNREVNRSFEQPCRPHAGIAVLRGNLAQDGAVIKPSAASPHLLQHRGRAVVFENIEDFHARIDDESLDIDEHCIMVLKNCGPRGYPGMAEVGNMPLPPKVLRKGITDMVRISDARMSGTAYGTVILHVSPEAAAGGTLALVATGDFIEVDVAGRRLHLEVSEAELAERRRHWQPPAPPARGWTRLYVEHVQQAHLGADLDFLVGGSGADVPRDSHEGHSLCCVAACRPQANRMPMSLNRAGLPPILRALSPPAEFPAARVFGRGIGNGWPRRKGQDHSSLVTPSSWVGKAKRLKQKKSCFAIFGK
jgi:dihydroxy-acid dehydratase